MMHVEKLEIYTFNRCHHCESVFLTNPVSENQLDPYYTDAYLPYRGEKAWGKYAIFVVWDDQKLNKRRVKLALEHLHKQAEMTVLDIGCGKPDFLAQLAKSENISTIGVDFNSAFIQFLIIPNHKIGIFTPSFFSPVWQIGIGIVLA